MTETSRATWAAWYEAEADRLIRFATFVAGAGEAPDIVQNAMVRALRATTAIDDRRAYVNRIIVREAQRSSDRDVRRQTQELRVVPPRGEADPPDVRVTAEPELHAAIRVLSPQQRAVIFHTYWEDLTPAEVARLLGCTEGTVRRALARARARLRKAMR